jgi:hypothetical protein
MGTKSGRLTKGSDMRPHPSIDRARGMAALLLAAAVAAVPAVSAEAMTRHMPNAAKAALAGNGVLNSVVATSAKNAWAVGHYGGLTRSKALIEHWDGTAWHRIGLNPAGGWLNGVAATSARDVWAVGYGGNRALILHFNGKTWRRVASPALPGTSILVDVTAVSPRNAWAVGITGANTLIEHWNGRGWTRVPSPSPQGQAALIGIAAASSGDIWAVGNARGTIILHWNGAVWRRVHSPSPRPAATLERVTVISARDAWAVGSSGRGTLIVHWNGIAWKRASSGAVRATAGLEGVSGTSARNVWAVGATGGLVAASAGVMRPAARVTAAAAAPEPLMMHWNGTAWRRMSVPVPTHGGQLIGVYAASGRSAWAVGCTRNFAARKAKPLVLRWNGTAWK